MWPFTVYHDAKIDSLKQLIGQLTRELEDRQWEYDNECRSCGWTEDRQHLPDCGLKRLLAEARREIEPST